MLTLIVHLSAKPGQGAVLRATLDRLVLLTRNEPGCEAYVLHEDLENPVAFALYEKWTTEAHWQVHMATPHLLDFVARKDDLTTAFSLHRLRVLP